MRRSGLKSAAIRALMLPIVFTTATMAQESDRHAPDEGSQETRRQPTSAPADKPAMPSIIPKLPNYAGDWFSRDYLTGDWGGLRTKLAEQGMLFDMEYTQSAMGNAYGGKDTNNAFRYSGLADYSIKLDTARMGLWPGGLIVLHGQTEVGQGINPKVGSAMPANFLNLLPVPGDPGITTLSEFYVMQALSEKVVLAAGKFDLTALADRNAFAGDATHNTQFSNTAFNVNPVLFAAAPYTCMTAGVILIPTDWLQIATVVVDNDPNGAANMTGFNTAFHGRNWMSVAQEYDFTVKPFDLTGHQRLGWFFTTKDAVELGADSRIGVPGPRHTQQLGKGILPRPFKRLVPRWLRSGSVGDTLYTIKNPGMEPDNWGMWYNFDQFLYTEKDDPKQGFGLFGRFGFAPTDANFISQFYSIGLGGTGSIPCRDRDTWGLGYYLANTSNKIGLIDVSSEQGIELFYNIEVTPWLRITPDIQCIIDPGVGFRNRDPALVYGVRAQIKL